MNQLGSRDWSQAELARRAGVSRTAISDVISGSANAGFNLCLAIAKGMQLPQENVLCSAGLLPPTTDRDDIIQEIEYIYDKLDEASKTELLEYAKLRLKLHEGKIAKPHSKTKTKQINS